MKVDPGRIFSDIGRADADSITVRGLDLADDLMGRVTFTELVHLLVTGQRPTAAQTRVLDTCLTALADHGLTPTVLAARLTYTGAPESLQGAIAAGLLGGGDVLLGPTDITARFLRDALGDAPPDPSDEQLEELADVAVRACVDSGRRVPGLGHPLHKDGDPRVPRLYDVAAEVGLLGPHLRLLRAVHRVAPQSTGRSLPINGAGAVGAALADAGLPIELLRGFALLARTAGLVGHLAEEREDPMGPTLWHQAEAALTSTKEPAP